MHTPQLNTPCSPTDCPLSWPGLSLTLQPGPEPWPVWMPLLEPENTEPPFISPGSLGKLCNFFQPAVPPLENEAITLRAVVWLKRVTSHKHIISSPSPTYPSNESSTSLASPHKRSHHPSLHSARSLLAQVIHTRTRAIAGGSCGRPQRLPLPSGNVPSHLQLCLRSLSQFHIHDETTRSDSGF